MSKTITACQSSYIPWKGYFDLIAAGDEFVVYDDVQFTKNDWRNRNLIATSDGPLWLTIPVRTSGRFGQKIRDVKVVDGRWRKRHWRSITMHYASAPYLSAHRDLLEELYLGPDTARLEYLSDINHRFLTAICAALGIETPFLWLHELAVTSSDPVERLVELCELRGATRYVSGPSARSYLRPEAFAEAEIELVYLDYDGYPAYPQLHEPFVHSVSVVDLMLNTGPAAADHLKHRGGRDG